MLTTSVDAIARQNLARAAAGPHGRSAETVHGGHDRGLRQTVIALTAGTTVAEHESPGEATMLVLSGRVRVSSRNESWEGVSGELIVIPPERHSVHAVEDCAVLLTVVKTQGLPTSPAAARA